MPALGIRIFKPQEQSEELMHPGSRFRYMLGGPARIISSSDSRWRMGLPMERSHAAGTDASDSIITYGDYFASVSDYLSSAAIAVPVHGSEMLRLDRADEISIHLIKHGAFYHPAKVVAYFSGARISLVVNVALSPQGRRQLPVEVESLLRLSAFISENWVPKVFHQGSGRSSHNASFPMFAGQWFDGFEEVHRTRDKGADQQWAVWKKDGATWNLAPGQVAGFYRQAVLILSGCFDPHSLSAVLDWHNAAGDFVVRGRGQALSVRLITVRRYAPLFSLQEHEDIDLKMLLQALAIHWMRTSLWMRLDRMDGVREMVWADDRVLAPMWEGFVQGVRRMARRNGFPRGFAAAAGRFIAGHSEQEWSYMGGQILAHQPAGSEEAVLMQRHLNRHAALMPLIVRH